MEIRVLACNCEQKPQLHRCSNIKLGLNAMMTSIIYIVQSVNGVSIGTEDIK